MPEYIYFLVLMISANSDLSKLKEYKEFLLASNNPHKVREFKRILTPVGIKVCTPDEINIILDVEETAADFAGNAALKARAGYAQSGMACLADDSGLCVKALNGEPGVYSARFGGPDLDDHGRVLHLLKLMQHIVRDERQAYFKCVLAICIGPAAEDVHYFEGNAEGTIAGTVSGKGGFGYDPVFIDKYSGKTFAELSPAQKDARSHRGAALQTLAQVWKP